MTVAHPKPARGRRDPAYLAEVRQLPCVICRRYPCDPHHPISGRFSQSRVSDRYAYPLCRECHDERHAHPARWKAMYGPEERFIEPTRKAVQQLRAEKIGGR